MVISRWSLLRMRSVPDKICGDNQSTVLCSIIFFPENLAVYEVMRVNSVVPDRPQMAVRRVRYGCCIIKATNTHSEYVILPFPGNNCYTIASWCYIVRILHLLFRNSNFFIIFLHFFFVSLFSIFLLPHCFLIFPNLFCRYTYGGGPRWHSS